MSESPHVGTRVPLEWQQQIQEIAKAAGRKEAEVVREAIALYLGKTNPAAVKGAIASLEDRVATLEQKLAGLGRLVGSWEKNMVAVCGNRIFGGSSISVNGFLVSTTTEC